MGFDIFNVHSAIAVAPIDRFSPKNNTNSETSFLKTKDTVSFSDEAYAYLEKMLSEKKSAQQSDLEDTSSVQYCSNEKHEAADNTLVENRFRSYVIRPEYRNTDKQTAAKGDGGDGNGSDGSEVERKN